MEKNTLQDQDKIKQNALNKLDELIVFELKRLKSLSSQVPIYHQFDLTFQDDYFTEAEKREIHRNIESMQKIKNADINEKKRRYYISFTNNIIQRASRSLV